MRKRILSIAGIAAFAFSLCACQSNQTTTESAASSSADTETATQETTATDTDTLYQVSLLQGLTLGDYYGSITVAELKEHGDIGLGTFDALNGELIMLDGEVYRAAGDGSVEVVEDDETIPFSDVTFFEEDETQELEHVTDFDALIALLDDKVEELGENRFYAIRIDGTFDEINVRSEYEQEEPYEPLATVLETDQTFYDYEDCEGTIVGLYCPEYMSDLNATGWHLHFVSSDKTKGGHVLGMEFESATLAWDYTDGFNMQLPDTPMFSDFDLTVDQSEDIEKVEKKTE
ncbi:MAG: acetolactate decarboxylase [Eubacterium sp.]|nr:acetolactate decarboxylase [Eubacterium sp.]